MVVKSYIYEQIKMLKAELYLNKQAQEAYKKYGASCMDNHLIEERGDLLRRLKRLEKEVAANGI